MCPRLSLVTDKGLKPDGEFEPGCLYFFPSFLLRHVQVKMGNYCEVCVHLGPPVSAGLVKWLSFGIGMEKCPWDWIWSCE